MRAAARAAPWGALAALAILLAGSISLGQTLWAKVLTISGSVQIASWTPTPTETASPSPEAAQGCSPGFWKQEAHFTEWPASYAPSDRAASALAWEDLEGDPTLLEALEEGGGELAALLRQAVAALLNAAHEGVGYAYSVEEVLDLVEAARTTGESEPVKDLFEAANELGCPLPTDELEAEPMTLPIEASLTPTPSDTPTESLGTEAPVETIVPVEPSATPEAPTESPTESPTEPATEVAPVPPEPSPDPEPPPTAEG